MAEKVKAEQLTPMMRQYFEVKQQYPDTLLFFRLGDFYELFYDDAKLVSNLLNLTLTRRNQNSAEPVPMAGIPHHTVDNYVARLLKAGHSVVICDQITDKQSAGRNMIERQVTRIITPGTVTEASIIPEKQDSLIAAVFAEKGRKGTHYGFATLNLSSGRFTVAEANNMAEVLLLIDKCAPAELLYPERFESYDQLKTVLCRKALPLWDFDHDTAVRTLCSQFKTRALKGFGIENKHTAICAAGALLNYVKTTQNVTIEHITSIVTDETTSTVLLDHTAQRNLELIENLSGNSTGSLMAVLDDTRTPMGTRLLRNMIINPLRNNAEVNRRLDLLEALQSCPSGDELSEVFASMGDLERIVARIGLRAAKPRDLSKLRDSLSLLPLIKYLLSLSPSQAAHTDPDMVNQVLLRANSALASNDDSIPPEFDAAACAADAATCGAEDNGADADACGADINRTDADVPSELSPAYGFAEAGTDAAAAANAVAAAARSLFEHRADLGPDDFASEEEARLITLLRQKAELLPDLNRIYQLLVRTIKTFPSLLLRDGGVIAPGCSAELDELRTLQGGAESLLEEIEERERKRTGINTLKVRRNNVQGFYIEVTRAQSDRVPADYIRKQTLKNNERYITAELKALEEKTVSAKARALQIEKEIYDQLLEQLIPELPNLSAFAHNIALIDVALGLARVAARNGYTRPQVVSDNIISIKDGRHPVVEALSSAPFIANSIELKPGHSLAVISGPNMGGKSTFMRQTALIAIMARMGSFVPAQQAVIGDIDRIFTRIGASDDLASGRSTFMVEMEETAVILNNATPESLVIMDEVGRGTSGAEGAAIAEAIVQYLSRDLCPKTMFATHYTEVTTLIENYSCAFNLCFNATEHDGRIVFLYHAEPGRQSRSFGIEVAQLAGVPPRITRKAIGFYKARSLELDRADIFTPPLLSSDDNLLSSAAPVAAAATAAEATTAVAAVADADEVMEQQQEISRLQAALNASEARSAALTGALTDSGEVVAALKKIELDRLTPLAALNTLYELKQLADQVQLQDQTAD